MDRVTGKMRGVKMTAIQNDVVASFDQQPKCGSSTKLAGIFICIFFVNSLYGQFKDSIINFGRISTFDLAGANQKITRIDPGDKTLSLFIFLSPECPLCQNYTRTLNALQEKFGGKVGIFGIIPGSAYSAKDVAAFEKKYGTLFGILTDKNQLFTHYLEASVTPQAILLDNRGNLVYKGAIDDWVQAQGRKKGKIAQQYVQDAIEQSLLSVPVKIKNTRAFGCKINDY